ncbi:MAG: hypothetical protein MJZ67_06035 [Bacteroidales bacterium]|nr:hypothetical protein [Bacteroidales bacterium]
MKHLLSLLLPLLLLCSCNRGVLFEAHTDLPGDTWLRFEPLQYTINATSYEDCYNFTISADIDTAQFHEAGLPIMMTITSPDGETRTHFSSLLLRNHEGNWLGEFHDGYLHINQLVRQFYFFNTKGDHTLSLSQRTNKYEIRGVHHIHVLVERVKVDLPE